MSICTHTPQERAKHVPCCLCQVEQLRGELSLAEEGLANYVQEVEQLKAKLASVRARCLNLAQWLDKGCEAKHAATEASFIALYAKESQEPQTVTTTGEKR